MGVMVGGGGGWSFVRNLLANLWLHHLSLVLLLIEHLNILLAHVLLILLRECLKMVPGYTECVQQMRDVELLLLKRSRID